MTIASVLSNYTPVPESGCWLWLGGLDSDGYGKTGGSQGSLAVHRIFYRELKGPILDGLHVCHKCDTRACVNPDHLYLGTSSDNALDRERRDRRREPSGNRQTRLTAERAIAIYKSPGSHSAIARRHGIAKSTVSMIKSGTNWSCATGHRRQE